MTRFTVLSPCLPVYFRPCSTRPKCNVLTIQIFKDDYPKRCLHELLSSQLDVDRLDYVNRDSFYCGVQEGNIGAARITKMLRIVDDRLVVEHKGLYTVEH